MLAFLTTVRHPQNSNDYARVWQLLEDSVTSMLGQTDPRCTVVVVGNHALRPLADLPGAGARVSFRAVDFPPPVDTPGTATAIDAIRFDRGTKLVVALLEAIGQGADHVMFCDADDFLGSDIAAIVNAAPASPGWAMVQGYRLKHGRVAPLAPFAERCGTGHIVRTDVLAALVADAGLDADASQATILHALGEDFVLRVLGSHKYRAAFCAGRGAPLAPFPAAAAMKHLATGENHSDFRRWPPSRIDTRGWRPVDPALAGYFNLPQRVWGGDGAPAPGASECGRDPAPHERSTVTGAVVRTVRRTAGPETVEVDDGRHSRALVLGPRRRLMLDRVEAWVWAACERPRDVEALLDAAVLEFPERGAVLDGEVNRAIARFAARGLLVQDDAQAGRSSG